MRLDGRRQSSNVDDRRGRRFASPLKASKVIQVTIAVAAAVLVFKNASTATPSNIKSSKPSHLNSSTFNSHNP